MGLGVKLSSRLQNTCSQNPWVTSRGFRPLQLSISLFHQLDFRPGQLHHGQGLDVAGDQCEHRAIQLSVVQWLLLLIMSDPPLCNALGF